MTYELAKQLKDAGFRGIEICEGGEKCSYGWDQHVESIPTLSELIKACGDKFQYLVLSDKHWAATGWMEEDPTHTVHEAIYGSPEEAVANLWIALNEK